jgi:ComF family protein
MNLFRRYLPDFISLLFPECCQACNTVLQRGEEVICTSCEYFLPQTDFHLRPDNPVSRLFWGRVEVSAATACYSFRKGGGVQHLIHNFKYKGHQEIGRVIGKKYGRDLRQSPLFRESTLIVPVPLHPRKLKMRGFNQSECLAEGLALSLGVPVMADNLRRGEETESQTRKSRFNRWKNVESGFYLNERAGVEGHQVLLVDDVVTTGATLEACAKVLLEAAGTRVSIATLAAALF